MTAPRRHRVGEIYWYEACPPLDGGEPKRRPVIVLYVSRDDPTLIIVAATSTPRECSAEDSDRVRLPALSESPSAKTGLSKAIWALPRWHLTVHAGQLERPIGYVSGRPLDSLIKAVQARLRANRGPGPD